MIINVPLQIDEAAFEQKVNDDYANKVEQLLLAKVEQVLKEADDRYYRNDRDPKVGLSVIINRRVDGFMQDHKDEIVEMAAIELAKKLARTKRGKEILEEAANE